MISLCISKLLNNTQIGYGMGYVLILNKKPLQNSLIFNDL